jgi:hypothetical protein
MTSITITVTRTAKTPATVFPEAYLMETTTETPGFDKFQLLDQAMGDPYPHNAIWDDNKTVTTTLNEDNCVVKTVVTVIPDISVVPGLTQENAVELMNSARIANGIAKGNAELIQWRDAYLNDNFITTSTVTVS